jgi:hypothetical protein
MSLSNVGKHWDLELLYIHAFYCVHWTSTCLNMHFVPTPLLDQTRVEIVFWELGLNLALF